MKRKIIILVVMAALLVCTTCYATAAGSEPKARPAFEKIESSTGEVNECLEPQGRSSTDYPSICKLSKGKL